MSSDTQTRYRTLLSVLLFEREAAGGDLPESDEAKFVALLDELWWKLTPDEQTEIDDDLAHEAGIMAQETLDILDCAVSEGSTALPRRAA